jgi:hypothetical protein
MDFKKLNQTITEIEQQLDLSVSSDDLMDAEFDGYYAIHFYDQNGVSIRLDFTDDGEIDWNSLGHTVTFEKTYAILKPTNLQQSMSVFVNDEEVDNLSTITFKTPVIIADPNNFVALVKHTLKQLANLQIK